MSELPETTSLSRYWRQAMPLLWPFKVLKNSQEFVDHTLMVLSPLADTMCLSSKSTTLTAARCPTRTLRRLISVGDTISQTAMLNRYHIFSFEKKIRFLPSIFAASYHHPLYPGLTCRKIETGTKIFWKGLSQRMITINILTSSEEQLRSDGWECWPSRHYPHPKLELSNHSSHWW